MAPTDPTEPWDGIDFNAPEPARGGDEPLAYESAAPASDADGGSSGAWTLPLLCLGLALLACCLVIPQADANRRIAYEQQKLKRDLAQITDQITVNDAFLKQIDVDPTLAERLALRQMKVMRQGQSEYPMSSPQLALAASPFTLVHVPAPAALEPYTPVGGSLAQLCRDPNSVPYMLGAGLTLVAMGLVFGGKSQPDIS